MRYSNTETWIAKNVNTKFFEGTTSHQFNYRTLYVPTGAKTSRPIPVAYAGINFTCKQDALRNLERMLREYLDYELIQGEPREILNELAVRKYGELVPENANYVKVDERGMQLLILDPNRQLAGICFVADLIVA